MLPARVGEAQLVARDKIGCKRAAAELRLLHGWHVRAVGVEDHIAWPAGAMTSATAGATRPAVPTHAAIATSNRLAATAWLRAGSAIAGGTRGAGAAAASRATSAALATVAACAALQPIIAERERATDIEDSKAAASASAASPTASAATGRTARAAFATCSRASVIAKVCRRAAHRWDRGY